MSEDPRELARRLAEQAKRRHQSPPAAEDPRELARRLAEQAKQRHAPEAPSPAPGAPDPGRPLTAKEALAKARAARPSAPQAAQGQFPMPSDDGPEAARANPSEVDLEPTMPIPGGAAIAVSRLLTQLVPEATVVEQSSVDNLVVFRALWRAHLARARQDRNLQLAALANVLLEAVERLEPGRLIAARVAIDHVQWAAWIDLRRNVLLGVAQPVDVYLPTT